MNNSSMLRSLLIKMAMLAAVALLVLWIGWPLSEQKDLEERHARSQKQATGPQGLAERSSAITQSPASQISRLSRLDLNRATIEELQRLPGIGKTLAQRVVERRTAHGPYRTVDELREVKGIGAKRLARIRPLLNVGRPTKTSGSTLRSVRAPDHQGKGKL